MKIRILGSAAGGGFPQWNCNCRNCHRMRIGAVRATPRTQSSIAVSMDNRSWVLFNTSPDIRAQLEAFPAILPRQGKRDTGIAAIIYMDSQIDHTTGLLMLREGCPHKVYCTESVHEDLTTGFPIFRVLESWNGGIERHPIIPDEPFSIQGIESLRFKPIPLTSNAPPYSRHRDNPQPDSNIGIVIEDLIHHKQVFYAPGLGVVDEQVLPFMREADCLLVDGTFWQEDEMALAGVGSKPASAMGHLPQSGPGGMIEQLNKLDKPRKILIHINNTNPILDEDSPERAELAAHQIEVAYDGMELSFSL